MSTTFTRSQSFTITHARHLSSKVAADMHLCCAYYGYPFESSIAAYAEELALLLKDGYLSTYEFGFKKDGLRYLTWHYVVRSDGSLSSDDRAGKLLSTYDVSAATYFNFVNKSAKWWNLSKAERDSVERTLPVSRGTGEEPRDGNGYWVHQDRNYFAGGESLSRGTFRPF
jgi:hypothetical protein